MEGILLFLRSRMSKPGVIAALITVLTGACAAPQPATDRGGDEIVSVTQTSVDRLSIGDSWLYAEATWVEQLHGDAAFHASVSYWTYWYWYDQITQGIGTTIATGGNWRTANAIVRKYGLVDRSAFGDDEAPRHDAAIAAIGASLTNGALSSLSARKDRTLVRRELDRAWALDDDMRALLDTTFGTDASKNFMPYSAQPAPSAIVSSTTFPVTYSGKDGFANKQLSDAMEEWRELYFSQTDALSFVRRVQNALNDGAPITMMWFVDFNALEERDNGRKGTFNLQTLNELGPGLQGGHSTVLSGFRAKLSDGRTVQSGTTDAVLLDATSQLEVVQVANKWGTAHPERPSEPGMPAVHDVWIDYLTARVRQCSGPGVCNSDVVPLENVVLPPGY